MSKCLTCPSYGKRAFCSFGPESRSFFEVNSINTEYRRGTTLFREGDSGSAVYVICSGKVKVSVTSREGRTMILRIAEAGDVLGMSATLTQGDYEVTAEAMEPVRTRMLPLRYLTSMMREFSDASMGAAKALADDYRSAFDGARLMALPPSPAGRLAQLILNWGADAKKNSSAFITMPLTHEELASMTATSRETVTRTLSRLRRDKVIATRGVALTILQPRMLEALSAS